MSGRQGRVVSKDYPPWTASSSTVEGRGQNPRRTWPCLARLELSLCSYGIELLSQGWFFPAMIFSTRDQGLALEYRCTARPFMVQFSNVKLKVDRGMKRAPSTLKSELTAIPQHVGNLEQQE